MDDALDIAEVVRRTGLTARTLRFYEAKGLVRPLRTDSGRRLYARDQLERINRIVALKRAGLPLARIGRMMTERGLDLIDLVDDQLAMLEARKAEIERSQYLLRCGVLRFEPGEPVDIDALCDSIRQTVVEQAGAASRLSELFEGLDLEDLRTRWVELQRRIEAELPLDATGTKARTLCDEVEDLFVPLRDWWKARGAQMPADAADLALTMKGNAWPHVSTKVWQFLQATRKAQPQAEREEAPPRHKPGRS